MKIKFCGAARVVTGSCHLLTLDNGYKILLDCGLYQGNEKGMEDFNQRFPFDPKEIDCLILSHAHIDHAGRIPKLVKEGFRGKIIATHATCGLCAIMLLDSAKIQQSDFKYNKRKGHQPEQTEPLYSSKHVRRTMPLFVGVSYDKWFDVRKGVRVLFRDAGHILGSASVTLRIQEKGKQQIMMGFTGDIGRPNRPILRDPQPMPQVNYLICESTYGNREHQTKPQEANRFLDIIKETCVENRGKLLIPAFSVGRTQEIVYMLDQLETAGHLPKIPVFVDSPLAINATKVFAAHPECFDKKLAKYMLIDDNPFGFNDLHYIHETADSKRLNDKKGPCIIIGSSGMITAGRIKHHVFNHGTDERNTILLVGYCSPGTPGGQLLRGKRHLHLYGQKVDIKAKVEIMGSFSAHADRAEIVHFLSNQKHLKKLFLVHGELDVQTDFQKYLGGFGFNDVVIPALGDEVELERGE